MNGTPFKGIFYTLGQLYPNAPIESLVNVTPSSDLGRGKAINVINPHYTYINDQENWLSENKENSSLTIKFLRNRVRINSYSIKSRT